MNTHTLHPHPPNTRTLYLIDIENLLGQRHAVATLEEVGEVVQGWLRHVGYRDGDHVVIACNPALGVAAGLAVPGGQLVVRRGRDGADRALLDWASVDHIAQRYGTVVIGSGDGIFTPFVSSLRGRGVAVRACARRGAMARPLRAAAETYHEHGRGARLARSA